MKDCIPWSVVLLLVCAFLTPGQTGEVMLYPAEFNWMPETMADAQAQICSDLLTAAGITNVRLTNPDNAALQSWVTSHTDNGELDVLVLYGRFPSALYPNPNVETDGSLAELFIESTDGDAIFVLGFLFAQEAPPACMKAADVNDDGTVNIADPIALLGYLFSNAALTLPDGTLVTADPGCAEYDAPAFLTDKRLLAIMPANH